MVTPNNEDYVDEKEHRHIHHQGLAGRLISFFSFFSLFFIIKSLSDTRVTVCLFLLMID